jgi:uncharacterized protein (DUF488 family)
MCTFLAWEAGDVRQRIRQTLRGGTTRFVGYADYATGDEFAKGLAELRELAAAQPLAMMCSEALWWRCHRRLIADRLVVAGDTVCHISSDGRASAHQLASFAVVGDDGQVTYPAAS